MLASAAGYLCADTIPVRHPQGTMRGFLLLRGPDGKVLADGDLTQTVHRNSTALRIAFRFHDGSIDDETTVYSQHADFKLISDHHVQKGPSFPHPIDLTIDVAAGTVTSRSSERSGAPKITQDHFNFAPDLTSDPLLLLQIMNFPVGAASISFPVFAPIAKPRLVKVSVTPGSDTPVRIGSTHRNATEYVIKIDIGGVAGAFAPFVGKAPADMHLWILQGDAPAFVRESGQFYEGGPIWTIEQTVPVYLPPSGQHH